MTHAYFVHLLVGRVTAVYRLQYIGSHDYHCVTIGDSESRGNFFKAVSVCE